MHNKNSEKPEAEIQQTVKPVTLFRAWAIVFILLILTVLAFIDRNTISLMVDPIRQSFGVKDLQMSWLQGTAFALFFLLGSLPMGWIVDNYSKRWAIFSGVIIWSLATVICGLSANFTQLLIARCIVGLGEAVLQPAGWSMIAKIFPKHKLSLAISVLSAGAQVGVAISYLFGGLLIAQAYEITTNPLPLFGQTEPWQFVFLASGIPGIFLAFLIFISPKEKKSVKTDKPQSENVYRFIRSNRNFFFYHFLGFGLLSVMVYGAAAWMPAYLIRTYELDIKTVGLILAVSAVPVGMCGVIFSGWWVDRTFSTGKKDAHFSYFSLIGIAVAIIGGLGFLFDFWIFIPVVCFGIIQFLQPFSGVAGASLQIVTPVAYRGRISSIFIMFYNTLGMVLGPSLVVAINDFFMNSNSLGTALAINYIVFGSGAAFLLWKGRKYAAAMGNR